MKLFVSFASDDACLSPLRTCVSGGRIDRISARSFACETAFFPATRIWSSLPCSAKRCCAVRRSKPASVAPPIVPTAPNFTRPDTRSRSTGPCACTPSCCPIAMCFLPAVWRSTTTSPVFGHRPDTSVSELNRACVGSTLNPRFGAPPNTIALPLRPISCAWPATPPIAASTSGSALTFASSDSSNDGSDVVPLFERLKADLPLTTASVPRYVCVKIALNAFEIESVRTYVPLIIATPRTIATPVRTVRSFRRRSPRSAKAVNASRSPPSPARSRSGSSARCRARSGRRRGRARGRRSRPRAHRG